MPIHELENIGKTIRLRRETLGLTQQYIADLSEVGVRTIREIEQGNGKNLPILLKVADTLGMEIRLSIKSIG